MERLKSLKLKKLIKELEYTEKDYEYTSEIVSEADFMFVTSINDFLERNPDIKENYDKKITEKIEETINKQKDEKSKRDWDVDSEDCANMDDDDGGDKVDEKDINEEDTDLDNFDDIDNQIKISDIVKKIYREIVKLTHPDKVGNKSMEAYYIEATGYYNNNDKLGLYKICDKIGIKYTLDEGDTDIIVEKISDLKNKINFLESTFTWKWFNTESQEERDSIILHFINSRIS